MAITSYTGLPGAGKSYGVVSNVIVPALSTGRTVVTNIPLHLDALTAHLGKPVNVVWFDVELASQDPGYWATLPPGAVFVLDEVWRIWPAGNRNIPEQHKSFLAEHRHNVDEQGRSAQVILVTQDLSQVAKFARILISQTYIITKLTAVGSKNRFRVDVYRGSQQAGEERSRDLIRSFFGKFTDEGFSFYQSHTLSDESALAGGVDETEVDSRASVWKRPVIFLIPVFLAVSGFGIFHSYQWLTHMGYADTPKKPILDNNLKNSVKPFNKPKPTPSSEGSQQKSIVPQKIKPAPVPTPSLEWRLTGVVKTGSRGYALVAGRTGYSRVDLRHCRNRSGSYECIFEGALVSAYTGQGMASFAIAPGENIRSTR